MWPRPSASSTSRTARSSSSATAMAARSSPLPAEEGRQNTQQRQRTQHEANYGLQGYDEEQRHTDTLPEKPEDAPAKIAGNGWSAVADRNRAGDAQGGQRRLLLRARVGRSSTTWPTAFSPLPG